MSIIKKRFLLPIALLILFVVASSINSAIIVYAPTTTEWDVGLTATLDPYSDSSEFGVRNDATVGFDTTYDEVDPPTPITGVASYFWHPDNPTTPVDLRKLMTSKIPPSSIMTWTYKVQSVGVDGEICISWSVDDITSIPTECSVYFDSVNMREATEHCFPAEMDTTYTFTVQVECESTVQYELIIEVEGSGDSEPEPGSYLCDADSEVTVDALPDAGWTLDHWELDAVDVGDADPYTVTMDGNHTLTAVFTEEPTPPQPTIESCDSIGVLEDRFGLEETVYVKGGSYSPLTTCNIHVVDDVVWSDGTPIPLRISGTATEVSSDSSGNISPTAVWSDPLIVGKYDIVVDVNRNGVYDEGTDALDDSDIEVTAGFFVIPELSIGTILGLVGCFAAFARAKVRELELKESLLFVLVSLLLSIIFMAGFLLPRTSISNVSALETTANIGVYWDENCSLTATLVDWGILRLGEVKEVVVYVRNEGDDQFLLALTPANWNPTNASSYLHFSWNCIDNRIGVSEVEKVSLSLQVFPNTTRDFDFSFDIIFETRKYSDTQSVLDLYAGWNMVSFPCTPQDSSFSNILSYVEYYQVLTWNDTGYVTASNSKAGMGYWILVLDDCNVTITGMPVQSYELDLPAGWSMIGSVFQCIVDADCVFPGYYTLMTWDGASYIQSTTIEPGKGYWALVLEETHIVVDDSCCMPS